MHKKLYIATILVLLGAGAWAQQFQQFSQYQFVQYAFNPAFAGSDSLFNGFAIHRSQWSGITDAPRTYQMGLHAPSKSGKMGFGGNLFTDVTGPTRRFGVQGSYAYHIQTSRTTKLSFGVTFGLTQFTIDGSQITLREQGDQSIINAMQSEMLPDAAFGILWYGNNFTLGASATQILNNRLELFPGDGQGSLETHYHLTGSYKLPIAEKFAIEPAALVKFVSPVPVQADFSLRGIYNGNLWLGFSYRTTNAAVIYAGYDIMNYLSLGYSYDISTSDIRNYSDGSHELLIRLRFGQKQMLEQQN